MHDIADVVKLIDEYEASRYPAQTKRRQTASGILDTDAECIKAVRVGAGLAVIQS